MKNSVEQIKTAIAEAMRKNDEPYFAVFDFDNTMIVNDIGEATLAYLTANHLFKDKDSDGTFEHYHKLLDKGKIKEAYEICSKILSGFSFKEVESLAGQVIAFEGKEIRTAEFHGREIARGIKLREETVELMHFLKHQGVAVWVISASCESLVCGAMDYFDIEANVIGIRNTIVNGKLTVDIETPLSMFEGKVECVKKYISGGKKPLFGIGDSMNDLPLLEYCQVKAVVDRQNELAKIAKEEGWFLL